MGVRLQRHALGRPFLVGGKAASLSRLAAHYPLPPGFALATSAFDLAAGANPSADGETAPVLLGRLRADVAAANRLLSEGLDGSGPLMLR